MPNQVKSSVFLSRSGCLLPLFIFFNLFFGRIFLNTQHWLILEVLLVLLFSLNSYMVTRKFFLSSHKRADVIDVEGEVVQDKKKQKAIGP